MLLLQSMRLSRVSLITECKIEQNSNSYFFHSHCVANLFSQQPERMEGMEDEMDETGKVPEDVRNTLTF